MNHSKVFGSLYTTSAVVRRSFNALFDRSRGPVIYVVRTASFAWVLTTLLLLPVMLVGASPPDETIWGGVVGVVLLNLVLAPLVENAGMFVLMGFLSPFVRNATGTTVIVAVLSGALHWLDGGWRAIAGTVGFAVMAHSASVWADRPFGWRYRLTIGQHFLFNLPGTIWVVCTVWA